MKRLLVTLIALLALVSHPSPAVAALWCKSDPVVSLNGTVVDVTVEIPLEYLHLVNGKVRYTIRTDPSIHRLLIVNDLGYNGYGVVTRFTNLVGGVDGKRFLTRFSAVVPIDKSRLPAGVTTVPARLTVFPSNGLPKTVQRTTDGVAMTLWITGQ